MRARYWLISALGLFALGVFVWLTIYGYQFAGFLLCAAGAVCAVFGVLALLQKRFPKTAKWFRRVFTGLLAVFLLLSAATGIWLGVSMDGAEEPEAEFVVVLGAGVDGTVPSQALRERLEAAQQYMAEYPDAILILSGGQGSNENLAEAECMYRWLTERGADPERLRREENATSTEENIAYSLDLIEAEFGVRPEKIGVISAEYHLLRA
ncbi:MAG: YdcF family protein, partial [Faecousia sp.]